MLWGEVVRHSVYVLNRLPTRALSGQTPYEAWTGSKPNVSHIRVFGCLKHMEIPDIHNKKLDDRSKQVVNHGRESGTKAYRVYDPVTRRVHVSRDVIFEENKCWPWSQLEEGDFSNAEMSSIINVCMPDDEMQNDVEQQQTNDARESESTTSPQQTDEKISSENYDETPKYYRSVSEIYDVTEEVEIEDELMIMSINEVGNYIQVVKQKEWKFSIQNEINLIEKKGTWRLTELSEGHKVIDLIWIYKLKRDAGGKVVKHKARLVAWGFEESWH